MTSEQAARIIGLLEDIRFMMFYVVGYIAWQVGSWIGKWHVKK